MDRAILAGLVGLLVGGTAWAGGPPGEGWDRKAAAGYLDGRQRAWFEYGGANRGEGATRTSCVCCHTLVPFALARPVLRRLDGERAPTALEAKIVDQVRLRVANWADLDAKPLRLLYDFDEAKKRESRGTEAVLNALILGLDDRNAGRIAPTEMTKTAFDHLWETQRDRGDGAGSWDWLDFGLEPWEAKSAGYFGATLAAIAVGSTPGYHRPGVDPVLDGRVDRLRRFLKDRLDAQNLYNRLAMLRASTSLGGLLDESGKARIIGEVAAKRNDDGGWSLASLGRYERSDGTPEATASDGYATGLVLLVFRDAGLARDDPGVAPGLAWLRSHQAPSGAWPGSSLNKERDPNSANPSKAFVGKFMGDAATAYAVLALGRE